MPQKKINLVYHETARDDIRGIAQIYTNLVGSKSARKIVSLIKKTLELLRNQPLMGFSCKDDQLAKAGYRTLIVGNYLCFYRLQNDTIFIYHIVDGRTDYPLHLTDLPS
ncbi:MAG: type II toxin-antitoxin system RelE/ParE family toxin [Oscillospiraceae bacterium]|nr:type II toxin-antitoxin system RelE/ParE family toxin [Oscillospiraceae bacterium]